MDFVDQMDDRIFKLKKFREYLKVVDNSGIEINTDWVEQAIIDIIVCGEIETPIGNVSRWTVSRARRLQEK